MGGNQQLQELHDTFVWEVNAAVGEGRPDMAWQLADQYLDRALELITVGEPTACASPDCAVCHRPRPTRSRSRRHRWFRHTRRADIG
jgi:hypothetical protein